jgi:hypothetical protein
MARGLGDVLDLYLASPAPLPPERCVLVLFDPGGFVAARVATRLIETWANQRPVRVRAVDAAAEALSGIAREVRPPPGAGLSIDLATSPHVLGCDGVLRVVVVGPSGSAEAGRCDGLVDLGVPLGALAIGAPRDRGVPGAWVAAIPARVALRVALGGAAKELREPALAVAAWASRLPRIARSGPPGAFSPA